MSLDLAKHTIFGSYNTRARNLLIIGVLVVLETGLILVTLWQPLIGLGMGAAFLLSILSLVRPAWLFSVIYPLLISVGQIPLAVGNISMSLERLLVIIGGFGFFGGVFITRQIKLKKVPGQVLLGLLIWIGFYIVSGLNSPSPGGSLLLFSYAQKIALAYMVYIAINTAHEFSSVLRAYLLSGIVASLFTIIAYYEYGSLYIIREASYQGGQPILASLFQGLARAGTGNAMILWLSLLLFREAKSRKSRFMCGVLIFWFGVINLFALRRELLLTIPLGLIFLLWRNLLGSRKLALFLSCLLFIIAIVFIRFSPEWRERLLVETVYQFKNAQDPRLNLLLKFTPAAFIREPWLGYGPGNYASTQLLFPETVQYFSLRRGGSSPHNAWSATLVEAGFFSFFGFCLFLYGLGRPLFKRSQQSENSLSVLWSFTPLFFLQLLFTMFFGQALAVSAVWFWFGFLLAIGQYNQFHVHSNVQVGQSHASAFYH
jgi:hypothetical protein